MCAVLLLVQLLALVQATQAYVKGPRLYMCETLHVAHGTSMDVRLVDSDENVSLILREVTSPGNDSEEVNCFLPSQAYTVELKSDGQRIAGFLLKVDKGRFSYDTSTWAFPTSDSGGPLVVSGPCTQSVSHNERLINQNPTPPLKFGYKAPSLKSVHQLTFQFTVMFDYEHHLENVKITIPLCPGPCIYMCHVDHPSSADKAYEDRIQREEMLSSQTGDQKGTSPTGYVILITLALLLLIAFVQRLIRQVRLRQARHMHQGIVAQEVDPNASGVMVTGMDKRASVN